MGLDEDSIYIHKMRQDIAALKVAVQILESKVMALGLAVADHSNDFEGSDGGPLPERQRDG